MTKTASLPANTHLSEIIALGLRAYLENRIVILCGDAARRHEYLSGKYFGQLTAPSPCLSPEGRGVLRVIIGLFG
jgi:hypothetical protein